MEVETKISQKVIHSQMLLETWNHNFNNSRDRIEEMKQLQNQRPLYYRFVAPWVCLDSDIPKRSSRQPDSIWGFDLNNEIMEVQDEAISEAVLLVRAMNDPKGDRIRTYDGISQESN